MLLVQLPKLLYLLSLAVTITALPAQPSAVEATALSCEAELERCLRMRMDIKFCRDNVCRRYGDECKPCQNGVFPPIADGVFPPIADGAFPPIADGAFPSIADGAFTPLTSDKTVVEVQVLNNRAVAVPRKNHCIVICTHAHCGLLCTNPGHPPSSAVDASEDAGDMDTADLLAHTNALPDQLGLPLTDGMTTVITTLGNKGKKSWKPKYDCMWICSGKVTCRQVCDAAGALVTDGGSLPEGETVEGMGDCEMVEKGTVGPLMVCTVPEAAGGEMLAAGDLGSNGTRCMVFWVGAMPHMVCRKM